MTDYTLIIGQPQDPHISKVCSHLKRMGVEPTLFSISTDRVDMSILDGISSGYVITAPTNERVDFDNVRSVWNRLKQRYDGHDADPAVRAEKRFAWSEWMSSVDSIADYVAPTRWVNPLAQEQLMRRKAVQHILASEVGFRVPDTAITNDTNSILELFSRHERLIYKPNRASTLTDGRIIYTTEINAERVRSSVAEISTAPGIYQELIEKEYELRITIVGETIFPVRIDSQKSETTLIDWRQDILGPEFHHVVEIDSDLSRRLMQFHKRSQLIYGAYDVIITKIGDPVFLEVNPCGQWMWLEDALDIPISKAVAIQLAEF